MTPRKSVEQELTKAMIMDAARELFINEGYSAVSMRQIGKTLGYSHGSIYYHFKNKAALFSAMVSEDFHTLNELLHSIVDNEEIPQEQKLEMIFRRFIEFGLTFRKQYELMFLFHDKELSSHLESAPYESYHKFALAVQQISEKPLNIQHIWSIFLSLHGFVTHYLHSEQTVEDLHNLISSHVKFLVQSCK